jgi:hypothetical protein
MRDVSAIVVGPGSLGAMLAEVLACHPRVGRLVVAGRRRERCEAVAGQCRAVAGALGRRPVVEAATEWNGDGHDLAVLAPSMQSWWVLAGLPAERRAPLEAAGLGAWLPFHLAPLLEVCERLGDGPFTVIASYPDATGPVLAACGHRVDCGLGNVAELAAKFPGPVRLAAHHALCPFAFQTYGCADGDLPPFLIEPDLPDAEAVMRSPWPLLPGQDLHRVTAATAGALFGALLHDAPLPVNVPAPRGLPGGYPARAGDLTLELDLPWPLEQARDVNERAARWDGIQTIDVDGTVTLTKQAAGVLRDLLAYEAGPLRPGDAAAAAEELQARFTAYAKG